MKPGFYVKGMIGAVMVGAAIALVAWIGHRFGLTGNCSSTGYINGQRVPNCSSKEVLHIVGIFPAVGLGLIGLLVYGRSAPRHQRKGNFGVAAWSLGYLVVGTSLIASAWNPASAAMGVGRWGWAIPGFIFIPLGIGGLLFMAFRGRKATTAQRLLATGTKAPAEVLSVRDTGVTINMNPRVEIQVEVRPPSGAPFQLTKTTTVSRLSIPRVGDQVTVWYDPANPQTFALGLPERAAGPTVSVNATLTPSHAPPVPPPGSPLAPPFGGMPPANGLPSMPAPAQTGSDLVASLERLSKLHADGVLTATEYETAKARALAGA